MLLYYYFYMNNQSQIQKSMGNICPCLKVQSQQPVSYNVQQQAFDIQDNPPTSTVIKLEFQKLESEIPSSLHNNQKQVEKTPITNQKKEVQKIQEEKVQIKSIQIPPPPVIKQEPKKKVYSFQKKQYNPDDYRFINLIDQFKVKKIDSIKQQQFNIDNCKKCFLFIFDITANIYIDNCEDCFIFCAPCQSSIFLRDCKRMKIVSASKQFRIRDCLDCLFSIYCNTQPVIESSKNITFCNFFRIGYTQLYSQFKKIKMEIWNNHWSEIFDFTRNPNEKHFNLIFQTQKFDVDWERAFIQANLKQSQCPIPLTFGDLPIIKKREIVIIANKKGTENQKFLQLLLNRGIPLSRSFKGKLSGEPFQLLKEKFQEVKSGQFYLCLKVVDTNENIWIQKFMNSSPCQEEFLIIQQKTIIQKISPILFVTFKDQH